MNLNKKLRQARHYHRVTSFDFIGFLRNPGYEKLVSYSDRIKGARKELRESEENKSVSIKEKIKIIKKMSKLQKFKYKELSFPKQLKYIKSFLGIKTYVNNDLFEKENDILSKNENKYKKMLKSMYDVDTKHTPFKTSKEKWFGIELECFVPCETIIQCCPYCNGSGVLTYTHRDSGFDIEDDCQGCRGSGEMESDDESDEQFENFKSILQYFVDANKLKFVSIETDGSIRPKGGYLGVEVKIMLTQRTMKNLKILLSFLNNKGAQVNESCGLHVHLDARKMSDVEKEQHALNFSKHLDWMYNMLPKSRRDNQFCVKRVSENKYSAVNYGTDFDTVEVRAHSGTLDFTKINNWCIIIDKIFNSKSKKLSFNKKINNYIETRTKQFAA